MRGYIQPISGLSIEHAGCERYFILPLSRAPVPVRRSTLVCIVLAGVCVGTMFERYILVVEVPVP